MFYRAGTTQRRDRYLQHLLRDIAEIRAQLPITLATSEPEPDIAVVRSEITPEMFAKAIVRRGLPNAQTKAEIIDSDVLEWFKS